MAGEAVKNRRSLALTILGTGFIAGLLLAAVLPSLARKRDRHPHGRCSSNLKQIVLGIAQYYDDHTEQMPRMDSVQHLAADIAPYIGYSPRLFVCPYDKTIRPATDISNLTESSYAIVTNAVWQSETMTPLLFDKLHPSGLTVLTGSNAWPRNSAHKDGGNVLWTDGHVDWNKSLDVGTNRYPVVND